MEGRLRKFEHHESEVSQKGSCLVKTALFESKSWWISASPQDTVLPPVLNVAENATTFW